MARTYGKKGRFFFADREVNQATGSIQLTALFPNPGNILRPGQYAKVRAVTGTKAGALLIPQRAVTELQGNYQVAVVDAQNKVDIANVKPGDRVGTMWVIDEGLKPETAWWPKAYKRSAPDRPSSRKPRAERINRS